MARYEESFIFFYSYVYFSADWSLTFSTQMLLRPSGSQPFNTFVRERTKPSERPLLVGEALRIEVSHGQRNGPSRSHSRFSRPEQLLFFPSSSSIVLAGLSGTRSRPTTSQKIFVAPGIKPGTSGSVARNCRLNHRDGHIQEYNFHRTFPL
jgi:hypothetical protein